MLRHRLFTRILGDIPASVLAEGLTINSAVDTAWAIASPESYDLLVHRLGYQLQEFHHWMKQNLITAILAPSQTQPATTPGPADRPRPGDDLTSAAPATGSLDRSQDRSQRRNE